MTILGLVTLVAVVAVWFLRRELVQYVLGAAIVFPQTAAVLAGGNGLPVPYLAFATVALLSIPRLLLDVAGLRGRPLRPGRRIVADVAGVGLVVWAAVVTIAGPRIFAGIGVFDPGLGAELQVGRLAPLQPGLDDLAQLGYLVVGMCFVLLAGRVIPVDHRMLATALWVAVALAAIRLVIEPVWPAALIENMPGYWYQTRQGRAAGTFYEPSVLGLYLVAAVGYFGARLLAGPGAQARIPAVIGLGLTGIVVVANRSGTAQLGLVVLVLAGAAVVIVRLVTRPIRRVSGAAVVGALLAGAVALTQLPAILAFTVGSAVEKTDTSSFATRNAANARAVELVLETFGLGVGLGGNRPSSLLLFLASCLGVIGLAAFTIMVVVAVRANRTPGAVGARWGLLGALIGGVVAVPDLSTPLLWVALAACLAPLSRPADPAPVVAGLTRDLTSSSPPTFGRRP